MLSEMGVLYAAAIAYDPTRDRRGRPEPVEPPPPGALVAGSLPCPHCGYAMAQQELADHVVDVCDEHGYWFDGRELAAVLERSAGVAEPTTGMKWRRFLQGLFYDQPALSTDVKKPDDL
jgi:Zn-finger nucleic acid-binding protein